jgi:hypothetical protein
MGTVSVAEVQALVSQLPEERLPQAYRLLRDLADQQQGNTSASLQTEFMRLPASERRKLLTQQAAEMVGHYEQTAGERQDWQSGDVQDEY